MTVINATILINGLGQMFLDIQKGKDVDLNTVRKQCQIANAIKGLGRAQLQAQVYSKSKINVPVLK